MAGVYLPGLKLQKGVPMTVHIWPNGKFHAVVDDVLTCMGTTVKVQPHGRLGDLDALFDKAYTAYGTDMDEPEANRMMEMISAAPTIIPAEGGDAQ